MVSKRVVLKEEFIRFLKSYNKYILFNRYVSKLPSSKAHTVNALLNKLPPENWIDTAFNWSETSEGDQSWYSLNTIWMARLKEIKEATIKGYKSIW